MKTGRAPQWERAVKAITNFLEEQRKDAEKVVRFLLL
jgi:hypothetical protein